ncbi:putative glycolipid-binding domain-containing protein [Streptomyces radicis]|uniref:Glycolipid-binding domain-containing protein n=1 Tax=Streptomyces radicis TaxID=1750517 RepID=A0A3A9WIA1_9ACTN|nr:putative glycolipid-binding domain-containing protein [Streptomyces radicis]RKN05837.1 hypothetical protein D7319_24225 [Streptomyces radicis]RKN17609.1 hypothetical protein D7318_23310 [Streptomyces radicis]
MSFAPPPATAAWLHQEARSGFEVSFFTSRGGGFVLEGCTTAVEEGITWAVEYTVEVDHDWRTSRARVAHRTAAGTRATELRADGDGHWLVDGHRAPHLDGCLDVDLESSAMTNTLPVHRVDPRPGVATAAPAACVRAVDLSVERLEQTYVRVADEGDRVRFDYHAPAFDFACRLVYDSSALVLSYPGIATRAA